MAISKPISHYDQRCNSDGKIIIISHSKDGKIKNIAHPNHHRWDIFLVQKPSLIKMMNENEMERLQQIPVDSRITKDGYW